jgi:hypothetical protein
MGTYQLLDAIFTGVEYGLRFEDLYKQIKAKREAGEDEDQISKWLDDMVDKAIGDAQTAIDRME